MIYASFGKRAIAFLIDTFILSFITGMVSKLTGFGSPDVVAQVMDGNIWAASGLFASSGLINMLYYAMLESSEKQATFGKRLLGLKVVGKDGGRISIIRGILRYFGKLISGAVLLIGFIIAAFTSKSQALHDFIASTYVVSGNQLGRGDNREKYEIGDRKY